MPRMRTPRQGSMQFWPRKRAADVVARIRTWTPGKDAKILGFAGYKVGMTHVILNDTKANSMTKGMDISVPATILECPPMKIAAIMTYVKDAYGLHCTGQITAEKLDKEVSKKIPLPKKTGKQPKTDKIADVRVLAYTQPKLTTIGKKKPEFLELGIGGKPEEKLAFAQSILGKEIKITDVFSAGQIIDTTSITKGKGNQGPVKRFGLALRSHKSEKTKRGPGSLGPWHGFRGGYRTPHQGQMGFHQRIEYNKQLITIADDTAKVNAKGGFLRYGEVKNQYIIIHGSVGGASKRLVTLSTPRRPPAKQNKDAPTIVNISTSSKQ